MEIWKVTRHYSCSLSCFKNVTWNNPPAANSYFLTWKMAGVLKAKYNDFPRVETIKNHAHVTWEYPFRNVDCRTISTILREKLTLRKLFYLMCRKGNFSYFNSRPKKQYQPETSKDFPPYLAIFLHNALQRRWLETEKFLMLGPKRV